MVLVLSISSLLCAQPLRPAELNKTIAAEQEAIVSGLVFQVNDDAITSTRIIKLLMEGQSPIKEWASKLTREEFVKQSRDLVTRVAMGEIYNLLLYQHAKKDLGEQEQFNAMIQSAMNEQRKNIINKYGPSEALALQKIQELGTTMDDMLSEFRQQVVIEGYRQNNFMPSIKLTRREMMQYYQSNIDSFTTKAEIQFQLVDIQVKDDVTVEQAQAKAQGAYQKLLDGESFSQVAVDYSDGFRSKQEGYWRPMDPASINEKYEPVTQALQSVDIDEITNIIEAENRFFIAKLLKRTEAGQQRFKDVQIQIKDAIIQQKWVLYRKDLDQVLLEKASLGNLENFSLITSLELYQRLTQNEN